MPKSDRIDRMFSNIMKGTTEEETGEEKQPISPAESKKSGATKKEETVRATIYLRKDQHKKLKLMAIEKDADISALVRAAVDDYFERHEKL